MAIIQLSGFISNIKGSVNGSTFQRSASGLTLRNKPLPLKSKTNQQSNIRQINAQVNKAWLDLTASQRLVWQSYADFANGATKTNKGNKSANTGKMQFIAVNSWLLQYGESVLTAPTFANPEAQAIPCPDTEDVTDDLMTISLSLDTSNQILVTRVSAPQSLATNTANTGFRTLVYTQVNGTTQNWAEAYYNTYGILPLLGRKYWIEYTVVNKNTGAISSPARKLVTYQLPATAMQWSVDTTKAGSASDTMVIPMGNVGAYDGTIAWGDGTTSSITTYNDADLAHTYATPGTYSIALYGTLNNVNFADSGDKLKLSDISQWGDFTPLSMLKSFYGCANFVGSFTDAPDLSGCTDLTECFRACILFNGDVSSWDTSTITDMTRVFHSCGSFNGDVTLWDVSLVTNLNGMFLGCTSFNPASSMFDAWDVSSVTSAINAFQGASLVDVDLSSWDVSAATSLSGFMDGAGLSTANYDLLLNAWSLLSVQNAVAFSVGTTTYTIATSQAARDILTNVPNQWVITDGGGI